MLKCLKNTITMKVLDQGCEHSLVYGEEYRGGSNPRH